MIEEVHEVNSSGESFDVAESVGKQIPFFACNNSILEREYQEDIRRYVYCQNFSVAPYEGHYSKHPVKWINKSFVIKNALAKKEREMIDASRARQNNN